MTTKVTIETNVHPADVLTFPLGTNRQPLEGGKWSESTRIEPNTTHVVHVHCGVDVLVRELNN